MNSVGYMILEFLRPIQAYNSTREQSRLKGTMAGYPPRPALASARTLHCAQSPPLPPPRLRQLWLKEGLKGRGNFGATNPHTARAGEEDVPCGRDRELVRPHGRRFADSSHG